MIFRAGPGRERPGIEKLLIFYEAIINIIIIIINSKRLQFLVGACCNNLVHCMSIVL